MTTMVPSAALTSGLIMKQRRNQQRALCLNVADRYWFLIARQMRPGRVLTLLMRQM
jgi:hypothetical protein